MIFERRSLADTKARAERNPLCGTDWGRFLKDEFAQQYWRDLMTFIDRERLRHPDSIYPQANELFRALELTWCQETKVVIVGQGADRRAREEIRKPGTRFIGSTAFMPEKYGARLIEELRRRGVVPEPRHEVPRV